MIRLITLPLVVPALKLYFKLYFFVLNVAKNIIMC